MSRLEALAKLYTRVRCVFTSNLPQWLPIHGLDYSFDRLAESSNSHRSLPSIEVEFEQPGRISELSILCTLSLA
jgi:hypothetical protein